MAMSFWSVSIHAQAIFGWVFKFSVSKYNGLMEIVNPLHFSDPKDFRNWLRENQGKEKECWIPVTRVKGGKDGVISYLDAVEVAMCFGWIDSTHKAIDGLYYQRFSPRTSKSPWTELNKERVRRLIKLGLMEEGGYKSLPDLDPDSFKVDSGLLRTFKKNEVAYANFISFPPLYQRVRLDNVQRWKGRYDPLYKKRLKKLIEASEEGKMIGDWNDDGRLL